MEKKNNKFLTYDFKGLNECKLCLIILEKIVDLCLFMVFSMVFISIGVSIIMCVLVVLKCIIFIMTFDWNNLEASLLQVFVTYYLKKILLLKYILILISIYSLVIFYLVINKKVYNSLFSYSINDFVVFFKILLNNLYLVSFIVVLVFISSSLLFLNFDFLKIIFYMLFFIILCLGKHIYEGLNNIIEDYIYNIIVRVLCKGIFTIIYICLMVMSWIYFV